MPVSGHRQEQDQSNRAPESPSASAPADDGRGTLATEPHNVGDSLPQQDTVIETHERRAKMERLRAEGIDPYPHVSLHDRTLIADVIAAHDPAALAKGEHPELQYHLAGRLISRRGHGKTAFLDLRDLSGSIQIVLRADKLGQETYERILNLDVGDIIGVRGCVYATQRGELAIAAQECQLLTKTLRPPPDKHHGLADTGTRYRYRELDLLANADTRELFVMRARNVMVVSSG